MRYIPEGDRAMREFPGLPSIPGDLQEIYRLRVEFGLYNGLDAALVVNLPLEQRPIAALLLCHHTDQAIIAKLGIDLHALQVTRIALIDMLRKYLPATPYVVPGPNLEPRPHWPHVGPWWRFWGQPTPVAGGHFPCLGCNAIYRLIWIEDLTATPGSIDCPSCGSELYTWQSGRQYRIERVRR
jgi:hypothetical protein